MTIGETIETKIETEKSFLKTYSFSNRELIKQCILETKDTLEVNPRIMIFGKPAIMHREVGFFSDESIGYYYSRQLSRSKPLTPSLKILLAMVNEYFKSEFNGILINAYKDGCDSIGDHSDDETNLDPAGVVAISYGAIRKFRIREKTTKKIVMDIPTLPNEIIHMGGDFQKEFLHGIPVQKKIKEKRYSLTFRKHTI